MKKAEVIERYGEAAYERQLAQSKAWNKAHHEEDNAANKKWRDAHPEKVRASNQKNHHERCRKGGKYYEKHLKDNRTGLRGARNKIRGKHQREYKLYKDIIAPDSQLHHEWCFQSAEYTGVALVEAKPHRYGIIDVILILDGKITVLTEEEVKNGKKNEDEKEPETAVLLQ